MSKRVRKQFKHPKTGHVAATWLPVEQNRLRGQGYVEVKAEAKSAEKPAAKSDK